MFDTHCHLNFKRFKKNIDEVIARAHESGVTDIVVPGTDIASSQKADEIAQKYDRIYAAVGIHPHHAYELINNVSSTSGDSQTNIKKLVDEIEKLIASPKVVAIGEVGMDLFKYENTKYKQYNIDEEFIKIQRELLSSQIDLVVKYKKSLIFHNRESTELLLGILDAVWTRSFEYKSVFHCCEPIPKLLEYAMLHKMFIGVDGDVTYDRTKQEFIKKVPLEILVVETDSPFILPEPLLSEKKYPNEPANIKYVVETIARLKGESIGKIARLTHENGKRLFLDSIQDSKR